jgi:FixJ family two-component response regulator
MKEQRLLVADKDTAFLRQVAEHLAGAGYQVETTESTAQVLCNIVKKQTPVLLLGSDFDRQVGLVELAKLLKKCNRHLAVVLVSDEASLPMVRRVRREGIYYHALRPVLPSGQE